MKPNTFLYTAEVNFADKADLDPFVDWYAYRHAPDLFKLGFKSCSSYRAIEGGMNIMDIYDMDDTKVFESEAYRDMSAVRDPYVKHVLRSAPEEAVTIYTQRMVQAGGADDIPLIDADWISMLRFEAPAGADAEIVDWLETKEWPRHSGLGATRLRFGFRSYDHPVLSTGRPRCILLAEWPTRPQARFDGLVERFGSKVNSVDTYVGYRLYPWADKPLDPLDGSPRS